MEEKRTNMEPIGLEKAYTFFMVPFYYDESEWDAIYSRLKRWKPVKEDLYKGEDVLYPYIMDLFKQVDFVKTEQNDTVPGNKSRLIIYEFDSTDKGTNSELFIDRILGKKQVAILAKNATEKANPTMMSFTLLNESNFAPHLFLSPSAQIGILTFSIKLEGEIVVDQQIDLNYALHKRNETDSYQCLCPYPENQKEAAMPQDFQGVTVIAPNLWKEGQWSTRKNQDYICWNLNDFVDCIMGTMGRPCDGQKRIKYFTKHRMHLFSFSSTIDKENKLGDGDIIPGLLRLARCVNARYLLPFDRMVKEGSLLQTYENIYFASAIEGTAMFAIGRENNSAYINQIHEKFNRQYLLIYLLVLIQRYTLQRIEQKITAFEYTGKQTDDELWDLINVVCRIKTNCYYTDVSIYTQHSEFYHLCCNNLHIPETFNEVSEKIELLKITTDRNIQKVLDDERKSREQYENLQKQQEARAEHRQHILNLIIGILTIFQVMQATYELITAESMRAFYISLTIGLVCLVLLICLMGKDLMRFFKRNK